MLLTASAYQVLVHPPRWPKDCHPRDDECRQPDKNCEDYRIHNSHRPFRILLNHRSEVHCESPLAIAKNQRDGCGIRATTFTKPITHMTLLQRNFCANCSRVTASSLVWVSMTNVVLYTLYTYLCLLSSNKIWLCCLLFSLNKAVQQKIARRRFFVQRNSLSLVSFIVVRLSELSYESRSRF